MNEPRIVFYQKSNGTQPIREFLRSLAKKTDKQTVNRLQKINDYMSLLRKNGTNIGIPYVKHISGKIWELRPIKDRIFFFFYDGQQYVMLHHFVKKTQKTPLNEIQQAEKNMNNFLVRLSNE